MPAAHDGEWLDRHAANRRALKDRGRERRSRRRSGPGWPSHPGGGQFQWRMSYQPWNDTEHTEYRGTRYAPPVSKKPVSPTTAFSFNKASVVAGSLRSTFP